MNDAIRHLDQQFEELRPLAKRARPPTGWVRAIRDALGMTTSQFARRMGVAQPRVIELEHYEVSGGITLKTLERAAEALGCRVVYILVPEKPLAETVRQRAQVLASRKLATVEQSMRLEDQAVETKQAREIARQKLIDELMRKPARLWDET